MAQLGYCLKHPAKKCEALLVRQNIRVRLLLHPIGVFYVSAAGFFFFLQEKLNKWASCIILYHLAESGPTVVLIHKSSL